MKTIKRQKRNFITWCAISVVFVLSFSLILNITNVIAACGDGTLDIDEVCDPAVPLADRFRGSATTCADTGDTSATSTNTLKCYAAGTVNECTINWEPVADGGSGCSGGFGEPDAPENVPEEFETAVSNATNWLLGFVGMIAVLMIIWGGINYIAAAGNEDTARTAKKTITYGIIGVVIAGLAFAIVKVIVVTIL